MLNVEQGEANSIVFKTQDYYGQVDTLCITPQDEVAAPIVDFIRKMEAERDRLHRKIAYYEAPLPVGKGNCYHRFTDEGLCIRCGEDAEEWDAGCVEEIVEELQSVTTPEFADALRRLMRDKSGGVIDTLQIYLERVDSLSRKRGNYFADAQEELDVDAKIDLPDTHGSSSLLFDL